MNSDEEAKRIVKEWYEGGLRWKDRKIFVVNTEEGANAYFKKKELAEGVV